MNKVILIGRLTQDPEVRYTQGAEPIAIARYTLAVNRISRSEEQNADFINCIAFRQKAEFAEKYLQKGIKIAIVGHIQTGSYKNREGRTIFTTEVVIDEEEFAESKAASQQNSNFTGRQEPPSPYPSPNEVNDGFMNVPDDEELPFV